MLHILFMILKITGIVIAIGLGLLLAAILAVTFVPLRYRIDGKCEGTPDTAEAKVKFSWLLHLVSGFCVYKEGETDWQVRIAWKKINVEKTEKVSEDMPVETVKKDLKKEPEEKSMKETVEEPVRKTTETTPEEPKRKRKKKNIIDKIREFFQKIKYTFTKICDNIKMLIEKKEKVLEFLNHEIHRNAFTKTKNEVIRLFRFLKPKKLMRANPLRI